MKRVAKVIVLICLLFHTYKTNAQAGYFGEFDAIPIAPTGCNSSDNAPVPGTSNLFVGRQYFKRDGSLTLDQECSQDQDLQEAVHSNRWGLVLEQLDWGKKRFSIIKPLVSPMTEITSGPIKGATIKTAYDANMVVYRGKYIIAFECTIVDSRNYAIYGTAACIGNYSPVSQTVEPSTIYVPVSGHRTGSIYHSVSVPQLLVFEDVLLLYWSEVTIQEKKFTRVGMRGAQLEADSVGVYWVKGVGRMVYSTDASTKEVWGPDVHNPNADTAVDIKSVWVHREEVVALAGLGGGGCAAPGPQPGCFRMAIAKASEALGNHVFNKSPLLDESELPTNPQGYTRPIRAPKGGYWLIGNFIKPTKNGYSEMRPIPLNWIKAGPYRILMFPFPDQQLWPTK